MRLFTADPEPEKTDISKLPTERPVAVYYRQSTEAQVGNISTTMQTVDMVQEMYRRGWREEDVILIDMDAGVSGTTRIDERPGMRRLFDLITSGAISAVATQDEDRLFRDLTQIQVNVFADACKRNRVWVLTPTMTYVFHHENMGEHYLGMFRRKSEMAAEYLHFMKSRMHGARLHLMRKGLWVGGRIPLGYMVETATKRYVPFEPHAAVVREVFRTFVAVGGNGYRAFRSLRDRGIAFDMAAEPPEGYKLKSNAAPVPTARAIVLMVTNPVYLGHWMHKGAVSLWDNHPAIVDQELFYAAFNLISPRSLDGKPNPNYRPVARGYRITRSEEAKNVPKPLLTGLIDGVRVVFHGTYGKFQYQGRGWRRMAHHVDDAIVWEAQKRMLATFDAPDWQEEPPQEDERVRQKQIETLQERLRRLEKALLRDIDIPELTTKWTDEYRDVTAEIDRLKSVQPPPPLVKLDLDAFREALEYWDELTDVEQAEVLSHLIRRVEIIDFKSLSSTELRIHWYDHHATDITLYRISNSDGWTYKEHDILRAMYEAGATREQLEEALPTRSWPSIRRTIKRYWPQDPPFAEQTRMGVNESTSKPFIINSHPLSRTA